MNSSINSKKEIHELMRKKTNSYCADCADSCALYVDMVNKIFLCRNCAIIHKQFGFEVKNVATDDFSPEESESLRSSNNQSFNNKWMALYNQNSQKIPYGATLTDRKAFLTDKYLTKQWFSPFSIKKFNFDTKRFQVEEEYSDSFEQQSPFASSSDQSDFSDVSSPTEQPYFGTSFKPKEIEAPSIQQAVDTSIYGDDFFVQNFQSSCGFQSAQSSYQYQNAQPSYQIPSLSQARQQFPYQSNQFVHKQPQQPQQQQVQPYGLQFMNQSQPIPPQQMQLNSRMQQFQQQPESRIKNYIAQQGLQQTQPQSQYRYQSQAKILQSISQIGPQQTNQTPVCMESNSNSYNNDNNMYDLIQQQPFIQNSFAPQSNNSNQNPFSANQFSQALNANSNPFKSQRTNAYKNQTSRQTNKNANSGT